MTLLPALSLAAVLFAQASTYDAKNGVWTMSDTPPATMDGKHAVSRYGPVEVGPSNLLNSITFKHRTLLDAGAQALDLKIAAKAGPNDIFIASAEGPRANCRTRLYAIEIAPAGKAHVSPPFGDCTAAIPQRMTFTPARQHAGVWSLDIETDGVRYRYAKGVGARLGEGRPVARGQREESIGTLVRRAPPAP